jgi:hypothetical protein
MLTGKMGTRPVEVDMALAWLLTPLSGGREGVQRPPSKSVWLTTRRDSQTSHKAPYSPCRPCL